MVEIPLTRGAVVVIDDDDLDLVGLTGWALLKARGQLYAIGSTPHPMFTKKLMHRVILGAPSGTHVDHINGNGLDNRRANLRFATPGQNMWNRRARRDTWASRFKGVERGHRRGWRARIQVEGKRISLGQYASEIEAARAYDAAALHYFGEFAAPNFPVEQK